LVQSEVTNHNKVGKLLDHLQRGGSRAFDSFVAALRDSGHDHAADILVTELSTEDNTTQDSELYTTQDNQPLDLSTQSRTADGKTTVFQTDCQCHMVHSVVFVYRDLFIHLFCPECTKTIITMNKQ